MVVAVVAAAVVAYVVAVANIVAAADVFADVVDVCGRYAWHTQFSDCCGRRQLLLLVLLVRLRLSRLGCYCHRSLKITKVRHIN